MPISRNTGTTWRLPRLLLIVSLALSLPHPSLAYNTFTPPPPPQHSGATSPHTATRTAPRPSPPPSYNRMGYLKDIITRCLSASMLVGGMTITSTATGSVARAAERGAASYYAQIVAGYDTLKKLEGEDWPKYKAKGDGDEVRRQLGTVGTKSPLFKLNKALAAVRDEVLENQDAFGGLDPLEFAEKAEAVTDGLEKADFLAYSSIFSKYGNGGGGTDFLEESHKVMKPTLEAYGEVLRMLNLDR